MFLGKTWWYPAIDEINLEESYSKNLFQKNFLKSIFY